MDLKKGMKVMYNGAPYELLKLMENAPYGAYWWCNPLGVKRPEVTLVLFKTLFPPVELYEKKEAA